MAGLALILIGMAVMLVAPLQRVTGARREHPPLAAPARTPCAMAGDEGDIP